ncbi:uncharacterized protein [Leuresthes tenuis]|uniref:uncharacterized protein n=1 Tax=Leuresthes tenuis TaxID=355514 RepID=UPI003B50A639
MFKAEKLKALVNDRLKAAAEDIFILFEKTIKDYEAEVFHSRQETEQQQRRLAGLKAPLQISVQEGDVPCKQDDCEGKTNLCEDDHATRPIKEEQEIELWVAPASEKEEEADTKDSIFNIIYVQRIDEDERNSPHQSQIVEHKEGHALPGSSSHPVKESFGALKPTRNCQMGEVSDVKRTDKGGLHSGINSSKTQTAGGKVNCLYTCNTCDKSFRIKSILTRHMKTHTGDRPHRCSVCGKSFIQRSYLQTHMSAHSGHKPYACSFCGKGFTQVGNMNAHMRIHTGEKPHSCADCGKSFREKADLVKHTVIHTGEKPYSCTACDMKFSAQSNLTRHTKTHSGERPFSCTACGKRFIRRSHLIAHTKTHTVEKTRPRQSGSERALDER